METIYPGGMYVYSDESTGLAETIEVRWVVPGEYGVNEVRSHVGSYIPADVTAQMAGLRHVLIVCRTAKKLWGFFLGVDNG